MLRRKTGIPKISRAEEEKISSYKHRLFFSLFYLFFFSANLINKGQKKKKEKKVNRCEEKSSLSQHFCSNFFDLN